MKLFLILLLAVFPALGQTNKVIPITNTKNEIVYLTKYETVDLSHVIFETIVITPKFKGLRISLGNCRTYQYGIILNYDPVTKKPSYPEVKVLQATKNSSVAKILNIVCGTSL